MKRTTFFLTVYFMVCIHCTTSAFSSENARVVIMMTHDSFSVSKQVVTAFEKANN